MAAEDLSEKWSNEKTPGNVLKLRMGDRKGTQPPKVLFEAGFLSHCTPIYGRPMSPTLKGRKLRGKMV